MLRETKTRPSLGAIHLWVQAEIGAAAEPRGRERRNNEKLMTCREGGDRGCDRETADVARRNVRRRLGRLEGRCR